MHLLIRFSSFPGGGVAAWELTALTNLPESAANGSMAYLMVLGVFGNCT